ncbi:hypothetical protein RDWZM_005363, partial [Blomia tropicalis]
IVDSLLPLISILYPGFGRILVLKQTAVATHCYNRVNGPLPLKPIFGTRKIRMNGGRRSK